MMLRTWTGGLAFTVTLSAVIGIASADTPVAQLSIVFKSNVISIGGATRNQPIYLFGIAREPRGYITSVQAYEARLIDESGTGTVSYPFDSKVRHRSIWVAVDLVSGSATAATPEGYKAEVVSLTDRHLKKDPAGAIAQLAADGVLVEFVVIRPGVGIWGQSVGSRGPADEGIEDGRVTVSVANLRPRGGTTDPPPQKLKKGDVVFVLDSFYAKYGLAVVGN